MSVDKKDAILIWDTAFGNTLWAKDCFGYWIYKHDYGDKETTRIPKGKSKAENCGWNIDHIKPLAEEGKDHLNNYEPMWWKANQQYKADKMTFTIDDITYQVIRCNICKSNNVYGYGIKIIDSGVRVDWKHKRNICFT